MPRRSRAREVALQVLYQIDLQPDSNLEDLDRFVRERLHEHRDSVEFCRSLIQGVRRNRAELDQMIEEIAEHWSIARMAATDRNVLRIGAFELVYTQIPGQVVINEAVELARRFGTRQSGPFVNGLLDRVLKQTKSS
ncbi:MAG: transcription antitermination factor NusB [Planctomycetales bacterium]|nr:transcription antitermination factor NusB [Planctomycetales bacterium]